jgi:hypothetical protein
MLLLNRDRSPDTADAGCSGGAQLPSALIRVTLPPEHPEGVAMNQPYPSSGQPVGISL